MCERESSEGVKDLVVKETHDACRISFGAYIDSFFFSFFLVFLVFGFLVFWFFFGFFCGFLFNIFTCTWFLFIKVEG